MREEFSVGVIISTYNNPEWLKKTLWGYLYQVRPVQEIIIADDGSTNETKELIESFRKELLIKHVWQKDEGFGKTRILNKALLQATSDYLIFTDQDCVPSPHFVETHCRYARKGRFLSAGYFKLSMPISKLVSQDMIKSGELFTLSFLKKHGQPYSFKWTKLIHNNAFKQFMNFITPARATWNGCNASGWREDFLQINGFNEEMLYGGEDREFGERLKNLGIKPKQLRYSAIVMHLDHDRPYKNQAVMQKNRSIIEQTKKNKTTITPVGIHKHQTV